MQTFLLIVIFILIVINLKQADELRDLERKTLDAFRTRTNTKNNDIKSDMIVKNDRKEYASDLTDNQWELIK